MQSFQIEYVFIECVKIEFSSYYVDVWCVWIYTVLSFYGCLQVHNGIVLLHKKKFLCTQFLSFFVLVWLFLYLQKAVPASEVCDEI